jgi:rare lipoprotein A (peptidoglycan hydrolase)
MTNRRGYLLAIALAVAFAVSPAAAVASPALPPVATSTPTTFGASVDATTAQVLTLLTSITDVQAEQIAIDNRIAVASTHALDQASRLDRVNAEFESAQAAFDENTIALYKFGGLGAFALLLDASSWDDFVARVTLLTRIIDLDRQTLEEASVVADQAQFQAAQLQRLQASLAALRDLKASRLQVLQSAQAQERSMLALLSPAGTLAVDARERQTAALRARWRAASVPVGTPIHRLTGRVLPHAGNYLVSQYQYRTYRSQNIGFRATASWYGTDFNGLETASGELFNADDFTCAHPSLPFGTWLAIARRDPLTKADRRIVVVVNDRGPFAEGQDLELSQAAADALGMTSMGVATVSVEQVTPVR